jgi:hypothetical protein
MRFFTASMFALLCSTVFGSPIELPRVLPSSTLAELEAGVQIRRVFWEGETLEVCPDFDGREQYRAAVRELRPLVGVEFLLLYEPPAGAPADETSRRRLIFSALSSVSTLKGIEYFSASRDRMRIFFKDARFVAGPDDLQPLPDPVDAPAPAPGTPLTRYAWLDDSSLGTYTARVRYENHGEFLSMAIDNAEPIRKLLIPLVQPGALLSLVVVAPTSDGKLLFYGFSCVRTINLFGVVERKGENSFTNRLIALYNWFRGTYERLAAAE